MRSHASKARKRRMPTRAVQRALRERESGQYPLPLEGIADFGKIIALASHEGSMKKKRGTAHRHYLRALELEDEDVAAARRAYEQCLAGDCRHLEARINLGRLLHLDGLLREAEAIYSGHEEPSGILYFNLGILLEDLEREAEAVAAYREALKHDPAMADAHFNLALLLERRGEAQAAFRHLLTYRRLAPASRKRAR
jgi:tetratricopeptide (TPR) repeat protein